MKKKKICQVCGKEYKTAGAKYCLPCGIKIQREKSKASWIKRGKPQGVKKRTTLSPKTGLIKLHKDAWKLFSKYIRQKGGYKCYTCPRQCDSTNTDAGHFKHGRLDFDEQNVHCQCKRCNNWLRGNLGEYANHLIKDYGPTIIDDLTLRANQHKGYTRDELEKIIEDLK